VPLFGSLPHQEKSTGLARQAAARRCRSRGEGEPHIGLVHIPVVLRHHLHHTSREPRSARRGSRRQESVRQGQRAGQIRGSRGGRWAPHRGGGLLIAVGVHDADAGVHGGRLFLPRLRDVCTPATGGRESDQGSAEQGRGRRASEGRELARRQGGAGQRGSGLHGRQYSYFLMRSVLSCFKAALQEGGTQVNGQGANQGPGVVEPQGRGNTARASKQGGMGRSLRAASGRGVEVCPHQALKEDPIGLCPCP
jgi:hypothetical protein